MSLLTKEEYERVKADKHLVVLDSSGGYGLTMIYAADMVQTVEALRKVAKVEMEDARELWLETYDHDDPDLPPPPESFEEWLETEYPQLADLPSWITDDD